MIKLIIHRTGDQRRIIICCSFLAAIVDPKKERSPSFYFFSNFHPEKCLTLHYVTLLITHEPID